VVVVVVVVVPEEREADYLLEANFPHSSRRILIHTLPRAARRALDRLHGRIATTLLPRHIKRR
jgi:hypothetical protein